MFYSLYNDRICVDDIVYICVLYAIPDSQYQVWSTEKKTFSTLSGHSPVPGTAPV